MPSLNSCHFIGNLTRKPETRQTPGGKNSVNFGLAINERFNGQETTSFLDFTAWDANADFIARYLTKGSLVYIEAKARQDVWTDKNGTTQRKTRFTVRNIQAIEPSRQNTPAAAPPTSHYQQKANGYQPQYSTEDIPFNHTPQP